MVKSDNIKENTHPGAPQLPGSVGNDLEIPEALKKGVMMTKISDKKEKQALFRIDPDEGRIHYESRTGGIVPIETIKELRTGADCRYYRLQFKLPEDTEDRWITAIYILEGTYKTLHMIAPTRDVFHQWDVALKKLYAIRQGLMNGLGNVEIRRNVWERQYWKGADEEGDQVLDFDDVERLCTRLNVNLTTDQLRKLFKEADTQNRGHLEFEDFQNFVKVLKRRPEIEVIYGRMSSANGGTLDFKEFAKFMSEIQKSTLGTDQLKSIFSKYATPQRTPEAADAPSNESSSAMTLDGFTSFLSSPDNAVFSEQSRPIWQDMTQPISEYYISSSHNTYLVGHQLVGVSTIEGYIRALLHSCRSVELDIYDGDEEPMIYHGKTLTSKVSLRDICQAIAKYAFITSPYPLLISAEVHCGVRQQEKMVDIMNEVFGESLIQAPVEGRPKITVLPSPEDLKHKFLLKAKNLYVVDQLAAVQEQKAAEKAAAQKQAILEAEPPSSTSSSSDDVAAIKEGIKDLKTKWRKMRGKDAKPEKPRVKMSFRLASLLVYTVGVKCHGFSADVEYAPEHIFSLSENTANRLLKASMTELVKHNQTHLTRVYPKGTRVNSTNFEPHRFWAAGSQVVAINWQTFDLGYMINQAMFQRNGRSGFVLKPEALRSGGEDLMKKRTKHFFDVTIISAQQLPRLRDSRGEEIIEKSIVDPFVEVSLHIPDWTHSPFLPESATAAGAKYYPSTDATTTSATSARTVSFSTKVIKNNGFNPVWQEELCLPFDCVGDMKELIFVEFAVRQNGKDDDDDEPIALYCTPLGCLERGFRHLPLHDSQLSQHLFSTLFVQINVRDVE
ncbi:1-phosphatidylinositol-4,5-bisphosphate phosphodiesterase 1 [Crucibulum laeve]|uniref:Phosphoinositide phospholipase C n=1 Tax=Crucibulum laeve TaxID=68775 RepID=A0A5C3LGU6_9AGAR|nr:1-phosphatidylinositol-4,5-bisphosphate phosphodiesterase 1 [Crucibulum laeve]